MVTILRNQVASMVDLDFPNGMPEQLVAALDDPAQKELRGLEEIGLRWMDELDADQLEKSVQRLRDAARSAPDNGTAHDDEGITDLDEIKDTCWFAWAYGRSASWLWYPRSQLQRGEASIFHEQKRLYLTPDPDSEGDAWRTTILVLPDRKVGVVTTWFIETPGGDPWEAKNRAWDDAKYRDEVFRPVTSLVPDFSAERQYPFMSVQLHEPDLTSFCGEEFLRVGAWLTGGYEDESDERRRDLLDAANNLSIRRYERLFLRWTDALALYNHETLASEEDRRKLVAGEAVHDAVYQLAKLRAAQLFEHCILARRVIRTDAREVTTLASSIGAVRTFPVLSRGWRRANAVLTSFSQAEYEMVTAPPVCSVEADELVDRAVERFGIPALLADTRRAYEELDRRLQWIRGQWLAVLAVIAFAIQAILTLIS